MLRIWSIFSCFITEKPFPNIAANLQYSLVDIFNKVYIDRHIWGKSLNKTQYMSVS
jgi:hypothetical protein